MKRFFMTSTAVTIVLFVIVMTTIFFLPTIEEYNKLKKEKTKLENLVNKYQESENKLQIYFVEIDRKETTITTTDTLYFFYVNLTTTDSIKEYSIEVSDKTIYNIFNECSIIGITLPKQQ
jgi:hypothetical protein